MSHTRRCRPPDLVLPQRRASGKPPGSAAVPAAPVVNPSGAAPRSRVPHFRDSVASRPFPTWPHAHARGRRLLAPVLAVVLMLTSPSVAAACTVPIWNRPYYPDFTTLVAEGWIERVVPRPDRSVEFGAFTSLDVVIRTAAAHKGWVPDRLIFREEASLVTRVDASGKVLAHEWAGSSGACGLFDFDPTGLYVVIAFREARGVPSPGAIQTVALGRAPNDRWVADLRQQIQSYPPPSMPPLIVPTVTGSDSWSGIARLVSMLILMILLLTAGGSMSLTVGGWVLKWLQRRR
jgi:hypothetical protein